MKIFIVIVSISAIALGLFGLQLEHQNSLAILAPALPTGTPWPDISGVINQDFVFTTTDNSYSVPAATLQTWVTPYWRAYAQRQEFDLKAELVREYLAKLASTLDRPPQNARLATADTGQLYEVVPAQTGFKLDITATLLNLRRALNNGISRAPLALIESIPAISLARLQALGITARLGTGQSNFAGSPVSRVHNIRQGMSSFDGIILPADREFSFNHWLGEVTASTGYEPELVIKNKTVIPEYGGGLCQVSTTLFRAVMAAGLPILERHPHTLSVRYYDPQGYDATIYPGVSDFRFKNDTAGPLFIQSENKANDLTFTLYGRPDNRTVLIDGPHSYARDPGLKTWLKRIVTYPNGTVKKDVFYSNYQAPAIAPVARNPLE